MLFALLMCVGLAITLAVAINFGADGDWGDAGSALGLGAAFTLVVGVLVTLVVGAIVAEHHHKRTLAEHHTLGTLQRGHDYLFEEHEGDTVHYSWMECAGGEVTRLCTSHSTSNDENDVALHLTNDTTPHVDRYGHEKVSTAPEWVIPFLRTSTRDEDDSYDFYLPPGTVVQGVKHG